MNYAFVDTAFAISPKGGVKVQAEMWRDGLERLGHKVTLVSPWEWNDWQKFDAIIIFGFAPGCRNTVRALATHNPNIVWAPIFDPDGGKAKYKFFFHYWGFQKHFGLSSRFHDIWLAKDCARLWLVRSEEEREYVHSCLSIPYSKITKVPLHYRVPDIAEIPAKEKFCFHASRLEADNKNVPRLIEAAKRYGFRLVLAGHLNGQQGRDWLSRLTAGADNIEYAGEVSEEKLLDLYSRAAVFALPSTTEGVGMVALEAAAYGCEIVLTSIGAPKEYYDGKALLVDPYSVDEIGRAVMKALEAPYGQPALKAHMENHYSEQACCKLLNAEVEKAIG